jgi:hypothetical protein
MFLAFEEHHMDRKFIPAEYELAEERQPRSNSRWFTAFAAVAIIMVATIALVTAGETNSKVTVEVSK